MTRLLAAIIVLLTPTLAAAASYPDVECTLNGDKSSLVVVASNGSDKVYQCAAFCRFKVTGQRPLQQFDCQFRLGKNAAEKAVCTKKGGAPNFYSEISPTKSTCVPK
jgi:hypothetical protein